MTSKIKVDNINKVSDDTNIIKKCGSTTTVGSGSGNTIVVCGSTVTIGRCGGTVALASGSTQTGFGREGSVNWQTGSLKTTTFTAVSGEGYFINSSSPITMNLPAGSAGAIVAISDYARNFATHTFTIAANGSEKIGGSAQDALLGVDGQAATLVYVDSTKGWVNVQNAEDTFEGAPPYPLATGGNTTITCGNFKTHIFTSPGTLCVSSAGTAAGSQILEYLVVAGGGPSGSPSEGSGYAAGGGGGGGFRMFTTAPGSNSPLNAPAGITAAVQGYPITVGAAGAFPANGSNSIFSTITSSGGGTGGRDNNNSPQTAGTAGGSGGGGGGGCAPAGSGNTPSVSPPQGNDGGTGTGGGTTGGGGGGGAGGTGNNGSPSTGAQGGTGAYIADSFIGPTAPSYGTPGPVSSTRYFAGGAGGGAGYPGGGGTSGPAPDGGGGGAGSGSGSGVAGTTNTGGGGGGSKGQVGSPINGGSGIVIIRYRFQ